MHLKDTIEYLDEMGYDCYFANRNGPIPLTCFDWKRFKDKHNWSNIICVNRLNMCWVDALEKARIHRQR
jgi:hypothetical protein